MIPSEIGVSSQPGKILEVPAKTGVTVLPNFAFWGKKRGGRWRKSLSGKSVGRAGTQELGGKPTGSTHGVPAKSVSLNSNVFIFYYLVISLCPFSIDWFYVNCYSSPLPSSFLFSRDLISEDFSWTT